MTLATLRHRRLFPMPGLAVVAERFVFDNQAVHGSGEVVFFDNGKSLVAARDGRRSPTEIRTSLIATCHAKGLRIDGNIQTQDARHPHAM